MAQPSIQQIISQTVIEFLLTTWEVPAILALIIATLVARHIAKKKGKLDARTSNIIFISFYMCTLVIMGSLIFRACTIFQQIDTQIQQQEQEQIQSYQYEQSGGIDF